MIEAWESAAQERKVGQRKGYILTAIDNRLG